MSFSKILVYLFGCIAVCAARPTGATNTGYNYNQGQESSLTKILKAVLVHESTGNGVHAGSISGHGASGHLTVTKQEGYPVSPGYPYPTGQQVLGNIRVDHKSLGSTGHLLPQVSPQVQALVGQQSAGDFSNFVAFTPQAESQYAGFIHALFRPRTEPSKSQKRIAFLPTALPPNSGYNYGSLRHQNGGSSNVPPSFFDPAQIFGNGFKNQNPPSSSRVFSGPVSSGGNFQNGASQNFQNYKHETPRSSGYSYSSPGGAEQIAISQYVASAVNSANQGYSYGKPSPPQHVAAQDVVQYVDPASFSRENLQSGPSQVEPQSSGYHYNRPIQGFSEEPETGYGKPVVAKSVFKGQPYLPLPEVSAKAPVNDGYRYEQPDHSSRPQTTFKGQSYLPLPPVSGSW